MKGNKPLKGEVAAQLGELVDKGIAAYERAAVADPANAYTITVSYINSIKDAVVTGPK